MRVGNLAIVVAALGVAASGCGSSGSPGTPSPGPSVTTLNANGCSKPPALPSTYLHFSQPPPLTIARTTYTARIVTNCGTIIVSLDGKDAPYTVNSFAFLARQGYFNDTPCQRLTTGQTQLLQCGDPTGTGEGGPGYTLPDENLRGATYPPGTVAMANSGSRHSGGSQFFFIFGHTAQLPPDYTPFGTVTAGEDVLTRVERAGTDNSNIQGDGHPNQPVVIESFAVTKG